MVLLKGISPQIIPNTQNAERPPRGIFLSLDFFFLHKIDISPTFCLWLFKNQYGSSAFDSLSIFNSPVVYSPTSFYIWQRDSAIFIFSSSPGLLLLWWAIDMCLFKPGTLAHEHLFFFLPLHDVYYSIPDWFGEKKLGEQRRGLKMTETETFPPHSGNGKMASISLQHSTFFCSMNNSHCALITSCIA